MRNPQVPGTTEIQEPNIEETTALEQRPVWRSFALTALLLLACFFTLYVAKDALAPLVLAVLLNFLLAPLVQGLKKLLIPEAIGALVVVACSLCFVGLLIYEFQAPVVEWLDRTPEILAKISDDLRGLQKPVQKVSEVSRQISKMAQPETGGGKPQVELKPFSLVAGVFNTTYQVAIELVIVIVMLYFLLSSGDLFLRKLIHVLPRFQDKKRAVLIMREIEDNISRYLITVAMINACLGGAATLVFWAMGMPSPALWGVLGFLLNFIPYLGALTEIIIVGLVASATFPYAGHAFLVPAAYFALAILEANFLTPYVLGRRLTLNPVVIFLAITLWGFMWGILGVFLAVPVLVTLKIFCDHLEPLAPIGEILGD